MSLLFRVFAAIFTGLLGRARPFLTALENPEHYLKRSEHYVKRILISRSSMPIAISIPYIAAIPPLLGHGGWGQFTHWLAGICRVSCGRGLARRERFRIGDPRRAIAAY